RRYRRRTAPLRGPPAGRPSGLDPGGRQLVRGPRQLTAATVALLAALWAAMLWLGGDGADERLLALLRAEGGSTPAALARAVTVLGGGAALVTFAAGAALWLAWRRRFADALVLLAA